MTAPYVADCLCFSKDRPLQLDGYLRSLARAMPLPVQVTVLYACTAPQLAAGYADVARAHASVRFVRERQFGPDVDRWLAQVRAPLILFGCDDVVYHRPVDVVRAAEALGDSKRVGFSLRLGRNIRHTHDRPGPVAAPRFTVQAGVLSWAWPGADAAWGYPFELDGTLYRREVVRVILGILEDNRRRAPQLEWRHPNLLELQANRVLKQLGLLPEMACFEESRLVVPTVNRVQGLFDNALQGRAWSCLELEQRRAGGEEIDVAAYGTRTFDRIHIGELFLRRAVCPCGTPRAAV
ncbi:MAG: hypothetical protein JXR37_07545 [Kiritimatiellae bacterium]|nr:hypothetical protein [Kiritimatiellia bacterium]